MLKEPATFSTWLAARLVVVQSISLGPGPTPLLELAAAEAPSGMEFRSWSWKAVDLWNNHETMGCAWIGEIFGLENTIVFWDGFLCWKVLTKPRCYRSYNSTFLEMKNPNGNHDFLDHTYGLELHLSGQMELVFHQPSRFKPPIWRGQIVPSCWKGRRPENLDQIKIARQPGVFGAHQHVEVFSKLNLLSPSNRLSWHLGLAAPADSTCCRWKVKVVMIVAVEEAPAVPRCKTLTTWGIIGGWWCP